MAGVDEAQVGDRNVNDKLFVHYSTTILNKTYKKVLFTSLEIHLDLVVCLLLVISVVWNHMAPI